MPTPPLPSRDDDEHGAVTLWHVYNDGDYFVPPYMTAFPDGAPMPESFDEWKALPVAAYNALLARAATAKVAADLMRARAERAERFLSMLFESHWDGTIGRPPTWRLRGDFRHILAGLRGATLLDAIRDMLSRIGAALGEGGA